MKSFISHLFLPAFFQISDCRGDFRQSTEEVTPTATPPTLALHTPSPLLSSAPDQPASPPLEKSPISISFGGGSYFACTYEFGVLQFLQENFDLSQTSFLGDSAGCIVAFAATLQLPTQQFFKKGIIPCLEKKHEAPYKAFSQWAPILRKIILPVLRETREELKEEGSIKKAVEGRLHLSVTHPALTSVQNFMLPIIDYPVSLPFPVPWFFQNELVSSFLSDEDVLNTLLTSCHLPCILDGNFFACWRGQPCLDGGLSYHNPKLNDKTCRVNPFLWRTFSFWIKHGCFTLPTEEEAEEAYQWGYEDAKAHPEYWAQFPFPPLQKQEEPTQEALGKKKSDKGSSAEALSLDKSSPSLGAIPKGRITNVLHTAHFYSTNILFSQLKQWTTFLKEFATGQHSLKSSLDFLLKGYLMNHFLKTSTLRVMKEMRGLVSKVYGFFGKILCPFSRPAAAEQKQEDKKA